MHPGKFARIPANVATDPKLSSTDIRVYSILSLHALHTNIVFVGQRRLAELAHINRRTLRSSLNNLARGGHISRSIHTLGQRAVYLLKSDIFKSKVGTESRPLVGTHSRPRIE